MLLPPMDGFRSLTLFFLLPLILGCFLSPSKAVPLTQESNEDAEYDDFVRPDYRGVQEEAYVPIDAPMVKPRYRKMDDLTSHPTDVPTVKSRFRKMDEMASFPTDDPTVQSRYRKMDEVALFPTDDPIVQSRYRKMNEVALFPTDDPIVQSRYRKMNEVALFPTDDPTVMSRYRSIDEQASTVPQVALTRPIFGASQGEVGYRNTIRTFIKLLKSLMDLFIAEIQDDDKWDVLREVVIKIAETVKAGLDFVSNLSVFD